MEKFQPADPLRTNEVTDETASTQDMEPRTLRDLELVLAGGGSEPIIVW